MGWRCGRAEEGRCSAWVVRGGGGGGWGEERATAGGARALRAWWRPPSRWTATAQRPEARASAAARDPPATSRAYSRTPRNGGQSSARPAAWRSASESAWGRGLGRVQAAALPGLWLQRQPGEAGACAAEKKAHLWVAEGGDVAGVVEVGELLLRGRGVRHHLRRGGAGSRKGGSSLARGRLPAELGTFCVSSPCCPSRLEGGRRLRVPLEAGADERVDHVRAVRVHALKGQAGQVAQPARWGEGVGGGSQARSAGASSVPGEPSGPVASFCEWSPGIRVVVHERLPLLHLRAADAVRARGDARSSVVALLNQGEPPSTHSDCAPC